MSNLPTPEEPLRVQVHHRGDLAIVKLSGSASMDVCDTLQERLYDLIDLQIKRLILDMSDLDFMSSVGLGAIIAAHNAFRYGNILSAGRGDPVTRSLRALNQKAARDPRLVSTIYPAGDGTLVAVKVDG